MGKKIVRGVEDLKMRLRELKSEKEINTIGFRATFGAAKETRNAARTNARAQGLVDTGALVENIAMKRIKMGTKLGYTVGVRHGGKSQIKKEMDPWYWFILEFGSARIAAKPFLRPAFAALRQGNARFIIDTALRNVIKSAERLAKKRSGKDA